MGRFSYSLFLPQGSLWWKVFSGVSQRLFLEGGSVMSLVSVKSLERNPVGGFRSLAVPSQSE